MTDCAPEAHLITLPYGAAGIFGESPNGLLFDNRHTYSLSTPGDPGFIEWLVVNGRRGAGLISFQSNESQLVEQGIFQHGTTTVLLKAPARQIIVSATIAGHDRQSYLSYRLALGYLFSWDLATSVVAEDSTAIPGSFALPDPWTWTFVDGSGRRFHFDFAIAWLSSDDNEFESPDAFSTLVEIILSGDDPAFYSDTIEVEINGRSSASTSGVPSAFITDPFRYDGSARGFMVADMDMSSVEADAELYAVGLADVTDPDNIRWRRFQYVDYPGSGWKPFTGGEQVITWDIRQQLLQTGGNSLHLSTDPSVTQTWEAFQLIPGRYYRLFVESSREIRVTGSISYRERYAAI